MKTTKLTLTLAMIAATTSLSAGELFLSPRAAENQTRKVAACCKPSQVRTAAKTCCQPSATAALAGCCASHQPATSPATP